MIPDQDTALAQICAFFKQHKLTYALHQHKPIFTVEEGKEISLNIQGAHSKNLFLRDKKYSLFLVSVLEHKRVDVKKLSKSYGKGGFSFASSELLAEKMNLIPGSVTPYGLINDMQQEICFLLDEDFLQYEIVNFHPLRNDYTMTVPLQDFLKYCDLVKHSPIIIKIPIIETSSA